MPEIEILNENPITLTELREKLKEIKKRDKELTFRANKTLEYIEVFSNVKVEKAASLRKSILDLSIGRLKERHIVKVVDVMPKDIDSLKAIFTGENLTLKADDLVKIMDILKT
ncbi:MAG TPA: hypothetical protein VJB94_04750 [Candidatus Nanoarchaeia archaeon]|nr:hypothetical protein [Candidatus Nanoarchaeia archaeon]